MAYLIGIALGRLLLGLLLLELLLCLLLLRLLLLLRIVECVANSVDCLGRFSGWWCGFSLSHADEVFSGAFRIDGEVFVNGIAKAALPPIATVDDVVGRVLGLWD